MVEFEHAVPGMAEFQHSVPLYWILAECPGGWGTFLVSTDRAETSEERRRRAVNVEIMIAVMMLSW